MKNAEILKVINCEIVSSDKRAKVSGGLYITFCSKDNVIKGDYFCLDYLGVHHFQVLDIKILEENTLEVRAIEKGYWARKYDTKLDFDLRSLIGIKLTSITDKESISAIQTESCWC